MKRTDVRHEPIQAIILEMAIDRCFLQKRVDLVENLGSSSTRLLVFQLPSVVVLPSSTEAASASPLQGSR